MTASSTAAIAEDAVSLVRRWLEETRGIRPDASARRLAGVLKDTDGLAFTVGFIDGVIRPEDPRVAARALARLVRRVPPRFLPWHLQLAVRIAALAGLVAPSVVIPVVRAVLRRMVGHLVVDARPGRLGPTLRRLRGDGTELNLNLLGEAVLGSREAQRRLDGTTALLAREDVDYVSLKVSSAVPPHAPFAFDDVVDDVVERLGPLYRQAAASSVPKFINLDMEEYRDLDLTLAVFTSILDQPDLAGLSAGIVLQAYLPDALPAMAQLQDWAARRVAAGGAPVKVRLVKGANLPMEKVEASLHGWPLATWADKVATDAHYKRVLDYALQPDRMRNVRLGVAGHNLFDVAFAWLLAGERGVREHLDFEMLLGMAQPQAAVVRREVGSLLLYTPVVHPRHFDVAIAYLVRRLEEGASPENFISAVMDLGEDERLFARERDRFLTSVAAIHDVPAATHRTQDRGQPPVRSSGAGFVNAADTDPSSRANRAWVRALRDRIEGSRLGADLVAAHTVTDAGELDRVLAAAVAAAPAWAALGASKRAALLRDAAEVLEARRAELIEVMAAECGKTIDQADPEVSEAVDFALYYAWSAEQLAALDGARAVPVELVVVTPPWNFPIAIAAGSVLAALASGSSVVLKPAPQAQRCGSVLAEALWAAGIPREVLHVVHVAEDGLGEQLVADRRVGRLILTGGFETAVLFRTFRNDLPLLAETSGKNAIVVTPNADLDLAVRDVVQSAFGHAGQKCSAASLAILVGSVARSSRFQAQLVDAVESLATGDPADLRSQVGPLIEPAHGKLLAALTTLGPGERWLVEPRALDGTGRLWSPGVRTGVRPGSEFHLTEYFGPVLGIMEAATLEEAIAIQNQVAYGLTAGLHSLAPDEIATWADAVAAGNVYVNRSITGAIVQRQPFGGWKKSSVGPGAKAGGPNYLSTLVSWVAEPASCARELDDVATEFLDLVADAAGSDHDYDRLVRSMRSDVEAWNETYGIELDVTGLGVESNLLRYRPASVVVRAGEQATPWELLRVIAAGLRAGADLSVSVAKPQEPGLVEALTRLGVAWSLDAEEPWYDAVRTTVPPRIRLLGEDRRALLSAIGGNPEVAIYDQPVTESGRIELLAFLREQAVSVTAHRFGSLVAR
ncbi:bifunctional proline dehydrogenase/L-glutamate gamma-semialdehyde dehydrogenase [Methylocystis sp.]|uniref:bifunctional proline dehydrogenase/L-glutamate gamma-semialdehyde dehydrogenase n=1 Tax=Methylocystis sp. TaxID=1911079 RepID=UPI003DA61ADF